MQELILDLAISNQQYQQYYTAYHKGLKTHVVARSRDGRRVHFPANLLRPFVEHNGVNGRFKLAFNEDGRCQYFIRCQ